MRQVAVGCFALGLVLMVAVGCQERGLEAAAPDLGLTYVGKSKGGGVTLQVWCEPSTGNRIYTARWPVGSSSPHLAVVPGGCK